MSGTASAEDALALINRPRPAPILLDIRLPGMGGLEALRYFQVRIGVPVIFLTARREKRDELLALELRADDYVTKPSTRMCCWLVSIRV